ncbi:MAG: T9SS type A sorting domain-containing protein [Bacteroidota bacterium]
MLRPLSWAGALAVASLLLCTSTSAQPVCDIGNAEATLDINNVRAKLYNVGALFWRGSGTHYTVPADGDADAIFTSALWIAGYVGGELRMSASGYGGYEMWPGSLADTSGSCEERDRMYTVYREEIDAFRSGEPASQRLIDWPWQLGAPVTDGDGNPNNYDLEAGDLPQLLGDQTIWWVMNDAGGEHRWSQRPALRMEVQVTAFATPSEIPALDDATFYRFRLVYRGTEPLEDAYFGIFTDPDLGNGSDDYAGSDSTRSLAYTYNGDADDQGESGYGTAPPAVGLTFLDSSDGRRMTDFVVLYNTTERQLSKPENGEEANAYLRSTTLQGNPVTVGGLGYDFSETPTRFMFSGAPGTFWSQMNIDREGTALPPANQLFVASHGPFTMQPGDHYDVVVGIVWARGEDRIDSVRKLQDAADLVRVAWTSGTFRADAAESEVPVLAAPANAATLPGGRLELSWFGGDLIQIALDPGFERLAYEATDVAAPHSIPSLRAGRYYWRAGQRSTVGTRWSAPWSFTVATPVDTEVGANVPATLALQPSYPNPFAATTTLPYGLPEAGEVSANVYDLLGRRVATLATRERRPAGWHELRIDGARWPSGVYFVALEAGEQRAVQRVLVVR